MARDRAERALEVRSNQEQVDNAVSAAENAKLTADDDILTKLLAELETRLKTLGEQRQETGEKLAGPAGDKELLQKELARLQKETAGLEKQFHDLVLLRDNVRKLKEELSIARRIEYIKQGLYNKPARQPNSEAGAASNVQFKEYVVQPGDTLSKIANVLGNEVRIILNDNPNLSAERLSVGQTIRIRAR